MRGLYRVLVGKPEKKRPMGRRRRRWEDNIKLVFRNWDVWYGLDWAGSGKRQVAALVNAVMNLRVP
jgi:hypothetical protein